MLDVHKMQGLGEHRNHFEKIIEDTTQKMHVVVEHQNTKDLEDGENRDTVLNTITRNNKDCIIPLNYDSERP